MDEKKKMSELIERLLPDLYEYEAWGNWEPIYYKKMVEVFESGNQEGIDFYMQFGERTRKILMNSYAYTMRLRYGFTTKILDEYGWLERSTFEIAKHIELWKHKTNVADTYIEIGISPNGKYQYGVSIKSSMGCGHSSGINEYRDPIDTEEECIRLAVADCRKWLERQGERNDYKKGSNYDPSIVNAIINSLDSCIVEQSQLSLF